VRQKSARTRLSESSKNRHSGMLLAGEVTQGCVVNAPKDGAHLLLIHDVINKHGSQPETCWDDGYRVQASASAREPTPSWNREISVRQLNQQPKKRSPETVACPRLFTRLFIIVQKKIRHEWMLTTNKNGSRRAAFDSYLIVILSFVFLNRLNQLNQNRITRQLQVQVPRSRYRNQ